MTRLKSLHPNFFFFGSDCKRRLSYSWLAWQLGIMQVTLLGSKTNESEFIRIIHKLIYYKFSFNSPDDPPIQQMIKYIISLILVNF